MWDRMMFFSLGLRSVSAWAFFAAALGWSKHCQPGWALLSLESYRYRSWSSPPRAAAPGVQMEELGPPIGQIGHKQRVVQCGDGAVVLPLAHAAHRVAAQQLLRSRYKVSHITVHKVFYLLGKTLPLRRSACLAVPPDEEFECTQLPQTKGAPGVELLGGDAHLAAQAELSPVSKAGGGIPIDGGGVHPCLEQAAAAAFSVTMQSLWPVECFAMWSMACSTPSTTATAIT